jgi:hypothetical protein
LIGVQTYVDARTTLLNLEKKGFDLNFDSLESKKSSGLWFCLPVQGFCGGAVDSKTQGLILQAVPGAIRGDFDELAFSRAITNPSIVLLRQ